MIPIMSRHAKPDSDVNITRSVLFTNVSSESRLKPDILWAFEYLLNFFGPNNYLEEETKDEGI